MRPRDPSSSRIVSKCDAIVAQRSTDAVGQRYDSLESEDNARLRDIQDAYGNIGTPMDGEFQLQGTTDSVFNERNDLSERIPDPRSDIEHRRCPFARG